jgi:hypothetical protein
MFNVEEISNLETAGTRITEFLEDIPRSLAGLSVIIIFRLI